jgi:hypothetical protein
MRWVDLQGRLLAARYRLESQLGQGGMGSVWRAEHLTLHSAVAVKLMDPAIAATPGGAERFRREAQAAASLRSAHVVQVLDYGVDEGMPFLVMELLQGESLAQCLERETRITPERTLHIMTQVARAMARAHSANIVHRDLKPDNIFLVREDDQELVKVLDFGIAKTPNPVFGGVQTHTGVTMGTPHYMSPEQAEGKRALDHRADLWAMAVIACECLTGVRPFTGETWGELLLNICARPIPLPSTQGPVPPAFDAWFVRATSRDPDLRLGSAQELIAALRAASGPGQGTGPVELMRGVVPALAGPSAITQAKAAGLSPAGTAGSVAVDAPVAIPMKRGVLPLVLGIGALVAGGSLTAVWGLGRVRAPEVGTAAVQASASSAEASGTTAASIRAAAAPAPSEKKPQDRLRPERRLAAPDKRSPRARESAGEPSERASAVGSASTGRRGAVMAVAPSAAAPAPKTLRCYTDPFTGTIRLEGSGPRAAGAQSYPCKQNPFTGQYQKLWRAPP